MRAPVRHSVLPSTVGDSHSLEPRWRRDGRELFFVRVVGATGFLSSLDMTKDDATPQQLFDLEGAAYEPSSDGQRFLLGKPVDDPIRVPLTYVSNWIARAR